MSKSKAKRAKVAVQSELPKQLMVRLHDAGTEDEWLRANDEKKTKLADMLDDDDGDELITIGYYKLCGISRIKRVVEVVSVEGWNVE